MGALALLITAILATLVLYFWARKEHWKDSSWKNARKTNA